MAALQVKVPIEGQRLSANGGPDGPPVKSLRNQGWGMER